MTGTLRRASFFLSLLIVGAIIIGMLDHEASMIPDLTADTSSLTPTPIVISDPITITASELYRIYHLDQIAADNQFKLKTLLVDGSVTKLSKNAWDIAYVRSNGGKGGFGDVLSRINATQIQRAAQLTIGQQVSLQCTGGGMTLGSPSLKDCFFR